MQNVLSGQANVVELPVVSKEFGDAIDSGTVNFYLYDKDGSNAGKWYRGSDGTWQGSESIAGIAIHRTNGHWYRSLPEAVWEDNIRYRLYARESGNLHIPFGEDLLVNNLGRVTAALIGQPNILGLPLVNKNNGNPIVSGVVNFYLVDKDGSNAGKWYDSGGTWSDTEVVAGVASHVADGHWDLSLSSPVWEVGVRYRLYAKESGGLQIPVGQDLFANTAMRITTGTAELGTSPSSILCSYIVNTLGEMTLPSSRSNWPLYVSHLPDSPNVKTNAGAIFDTTGVSDGRLMNGPTIEKPGINIRLRTNNYEVGWAKLESIASALDSVNKETIVIDTDTFEIQNVRRTTPIVNLGLEGGTKRRWRLVINFLVTIKKLT